MLSRVLLLLSFAFATAYAADDELASVSSLKVDLDKVVEYRTVSPVDGITVSGQPNEEMLDIFAENGYAAVIDLRGPGENRGFDEAQVVEELGMYYVELPIEGRDAVNFDNAAKLKEILGQYDGPVLVHCGSGNRVGALLALGKVQDGASEEEALEYGRSGGLTRLEGLVRERLAEQEPAEPAE
ncbi:MAG: sulfur transferase domain-containing protein [Woeseiaceae bacterium]|nr:sulfur transferase domain-containing protein [Woeseiaceae bacterium]